MAVLRRLSGLKAAQLKHAAFLTGLPMAGTKSELENVLRHRVGQPVLFSETPRIVSVDMGIKNLGICVLEAPHLLDSSSSTRAPKLKGNEKSPLKILAWKKIDVLSQLVSQNEAAATTQEDPDPAKPIKGRQLRTAMAQPTIAASTFNPSNLCRTALTIARELLYTYKPSHILIERQRFRSGGAAAVQEWTLRVNMLESMIWACLETMRHEYEQSRTVAKLEHFPAVHEVNPARVALDRF